MSQRPTHEIERLKRGVLERNCLDCGWKPRATHFRATPRTGRGYRYVAWGSRCKRCSAAHESARKAAKYARDHPEMSAHLGRPRNEPDEARRKRSPCLLAQVWRGLPASED